VFERIIAKAIELQLISKVDDLNEISMLDWDRIFQKAFTAIIVEYEVASGKRYINAGEMTINTLHKYLF
jgi:hypothetical protein